MSIEFFLTHRVDWYRPKISTDKSFSEFIDGYTLMGNSIPVSIQPSSADETLAFKQKEEEVILRLYVNKNYDMQRNDHLILKSREFIITGPIDFATQGRVIKLICSEYPSIAKTR